MRGDPLDTIKMLVNGEAMTGGRSAPYLADGRFLGETNPAPRYRFFSMRDEYPALLPVDDVGFSIRGELYEITYGDLRGLGELGDVGSWHAYLAARQEDRS
jgi:gamma-glutamylcyclotransferase (GGCT)/AIG2-like uncharacterized protein YtfP